MVILIKISFAHTFVNYLQAYIYINTSISKQTVKQQATMKTSLVLFSAIFALLLLTASSMPLEDELQEAEEGKKNQYLFVTAKKNVFFLFFRWGASPFTTEESDLWPFELLHRRILFQWFGLRCSLLEAQKEGRKMQKWRLRLQKMNTPILIQFSII